MFAFVLMPFDVAFDDIYQLGIKEVARSLDIRAERVDEQIFHKENILERIYGQINAADLIISDLTGRNPNVFYETGYAHAKGKTCVLLTSRADDIPFDLKHHRHIIYGDSIQNLRRSLETELKYAKSEVINRQSVLNVTLKRIDGLLEKDEWRAVANVDIFLDLNNKTSAPSPEIEAIYFKSGVGWSFSQDGIDCGNRIEDKIVSHFLKSPVRRLQPNSWAEVKLTGKKTMEWKRKDNELKDSYKINGWAEVQILTSEGTFNFPIEITTEVDEFPF
jgi:nucleoside 2-deoxyribosyltransferase